MRQGIQVFLQEAGEAACYALCIVRLAEVVTSKSINALDALEMATDKGWVYYNAADHNDNDNFYVKDPAAFLSSLTGKRWTVTKVPADYQAQKSEYLVDRWERGQVGKITGHFRLPDWDPYPGTLAVRYGARVSRRLFKEAI
jgi:hypothetical protein